MFVLHRPLKLDLFFLFNDFFLLMMMEAVLTPSFASSSSAAQLHEFTFNKLPSLHTSVKSSSRGIHKQYALLISLSVFIWLTCNRLGQPIALMMHLKASGSAF